MSASSLTKMTALEAHAKRLGQRGYKLALWEDGNEWFWAWKMGDVIVDQGHTDAKTKALAFWVAVQGIA